MADIFISYSQQDRARVKRLVDALTAEGYQVWWDLKIRSGESFDRAIERTLPQVRCVVAVWSQASVDSDWVRAESAWAKDRNKLVSVQIDADVQLPLKFYHVHTERMTNWKGFRDDAEFQRLLQDIMEIAGPPPSAAAVQASTSQVPAPTPPEVRPKQEPTPAPASKAMSGTQAPTPPQAEPESSSVVKPAQEPTPVSRTTSASRSETGTPQEPRSTPTRPSATSTSRAPGFAMGMIALVAVALVGLLLFLNTRDEPEFGGEPEEGVEEPEMGVPAYTPTPDPAHPAEVGEDGAKDSMPGHPQGTDKQEGENSATPSVQVEQVLSDAADGDPRSEGFAGSPHLVALYKPGCLYTVELHRSAAGDTKTCFTFDPDACIPNDRVLRVVPTDPRQLKVGSNVFVSLSDEGGPWAAGTIASFRNDAFRITLERDLLCTRGLDPQLWSKANRLMLRE